MTKIRATAILAGIKFVSAPMQAPSVLIAGNDVRTAQIVRGRPRQNEPGPLHQHPQKYSGQIPPPDRNWQPPRRASAIRCHIAPLKVRRQWRRA
jgi:hypothetical protein